jgi:diguanylate cyclase (GGDEF)-like protein
MSAPPVVKAARPATDALSDDRSAAEFTVVMDALGGVLQLYGQHAFDTDLQTGDEIRAIVRRWMLHATMGAASPTATTERPAGGVTSRDWKGLLRFFGTTRRDETAYVHRALKDLRESIWAFVSGLHQLVLEEHEEGKVAQEHIGRVKAACASQDTDYLRRETMAAVSVMEKLLENRKERQRHQFSVLADKLKDLGQELEDARRESALDGLTGLPNRKAFDDYITRSIELHSLTVKPTSLLLIDVDNFKAINDTYGHPVGDDALRHVTRALSRTILRKMDFVCRLGGDEFAVIVQETGIDGARVLGEKLRRSLSEVLASRKGAEPAPDYTISVGVAELELGDNTLSWTNRADQALYDAKRLGRNQVASSAPSTGATPPSNARIA